MKKKLLNLNSAKAISKSNQKHITGGKAPLCDAPEIACYNPRTHRWSCELPQYCEC